MRKNVHDDDCRCGPCWNARNKISTRGKEVGILIKTILVSVGLLCGFSVWLFVTPGNRSHDAKYRDVVGKYYRTKVPVVIFDDEIESTSTVKMIYGDGVHNLLPIGSLFYVQHIQSKAMSGTDEYLSVIVSSGPYQGRKVDTADLWPSGSPSEAISSTTGRVSAKYAEEVHYEGME